MCWADKKATSIIFSRGVKTDESETKRQAMIDKSIKFSVGMEKAGSELISIEHLDKPIFGEQFGPVVFVD